MFDTTWGEIIFLSAVGIMFIGKNDLPRASYVLGTYTGRLVGLLQGFRTKANQHLFDHNANNPTSLTAITTQELKNLHTELQSNLRQLDIIKSEFAVSMSPGVSSSNNSSMMMNQVNNNLRPPSSFLSPNNNNVNMLQLQQRQQQVPGSATPTILNPSPVMSTSTDVVPTSTNQSSQFAQQQLAPTEQSFAAVVEHEWMKRGIGFVSRAERSQLLQQQGGEHQEVGGSVLLSNIIQQSLIYDQYDRVIAEQDSVLQNKFQQVYQKRIAEQQQGVVTMASDEKGDDERKETTDRETTSPTK